MSPSKELHEHILDTDVVEEMEGSFLEYAYSVIHARALPDARDGLKPVQRRILYQMNQMGLAPTKGHVKSARVVGEVMGKLHPHGDSAIYDAMVRMAQPWSMRLPLVDGHGNFGSLDDGPAASRYTEARLSTAALDLVESLDEDVVDFVPNYDAQFLQPSVLPAAYPNLLVNGAEGIAVGMATKMPPHNLGEVVAAARHLIANPDATLEELIRFVPGPDLPGGGKIVGLDGIREAYATGRGIFRTRAKARVESITARKRAIVITELPYLIGPERVIDKIKDAVQSKKVEGITAITDLTDRAHGLRLVVEVKNSFNPEAVLEQLYRYTPLEDSFGINNVALVDGQPRTLGLRDLLQVYVDFRLDVVRRRTAHRLRTRQDQLHLVEGLLIAILDIDEVIQVIRSSDDSAQARSRLMGVFDLTEIQAEHILQLRLRRLTKFSRIELEAERDKLAREIEELEAILASEDRLRAVVSEELADVSARLATPRRTILLEDSGAAAAPAAPAARAARGSAGGRRGATAGVPLEVPDGPSRVLLSGTDLLARVDGEVADDRSGPRRAHDALRSAVAGRTHGEVGALTTAGRVIRIPVLDIPALAPVEGAPGLSGGAPVSEMLELAGDEDVVGLVPMDQDAPVLVLATAQGFVKRFRSADFPAKGESFEVVKLEEGDHVVGVGVTSEEEDRIVLVSSDAQLLHFPASAVRPYGRVSGGMAGIRLAPGAHVVSLSVVPEALVDSAMLVTVTGQEGALPGTVAGSAKVTPFALYPGKGRATGGVRSHGFLRGEDLLQLAWVGVSPRAVGSAGQEVELPEVDQRRDGSGRPLPMPITSIG
ncbi:MAG TPA: DNA topoisomerase IV subunit A [Actinomycetales bacterium]|nr:DNA topoisomerase IV subunit A [Actinomycetales bacterium]